MKYKIPYSFFMLCSILFLQSCMPNLKETAKIAIQENDIPKLEKLLIKHKLLVGDYAEVLLSYAMQKKNINALYVLIEYGINPNYSEGNTTLLEWALKNNEQDFMDFMLEYDADVNFLSRGSFLMNEAIKKKNMHLMKKLIEHNIDLSFKNERGQSFFDIALKEKFFVGAIALISVKEYKKNVCEEKNLWANLVYNWDKDKTPKIIELLYDYKTPIWNGSEPLILAIDAINYDAVCWLLDHGISKEKDGYYYREGSKVSPLFVAYFREHDLTNYAGKDYKNESKEELEKIQAIIDILKNGT